MKESTKDRKRKMAEQIGEESEKILIAILELIHINSYNPLFVYNASYNLLTISAIKTGIPKEMFAKSIELFRGEIDTFWDVAVNALSDTQ